MSVINGEDYGYINGNGDGNHNYNVDDTDGGDNGFNNDDKCDDSVDKNDGDDDSCNMNDGTAKDNRDNNVVKLTVMITVNV